MRRMVKINGVLYVSIPYATAATTLLRMLLEGLGQLVPLVGN